MSETVYEGGGNADCGGDEDGRFGEGVEFRAEEFPVDFALGVDWGAVVYHMLLISIFLEMNSEKGSSTSSSSRMNALMERWSSL